MQKIKERSQQMKSKEDVYFLGLDKLDEYIPGVMRGSNIMMIGPPMSGKETIINNIAFKGLNEGEAAVIVSTREPGETVIDWFNYNNLEIPLDHLGIVDCVTRTLGVPAVETANIKRASSPIDLAGISIKTFQLLEEFLVKKDSGKIRLCINSLSDHRNDFFQKMLHFLHEFTDKVKAAGALGIYVMEEGSYEYQKMGELKQLSDGVIEIKQVYDAHFIRIVGLQQEPSPWFEYTIDGAQVLLKSVNDSSEQ